MSTQTQPPTIENIPIATPKPHWLLPLLAGFLLASLIAGLAFFAQKPNKDPIQTLTRESVISKIQTLNRLQTVAYNIDTVIQSHKDGSWQKLWTDEQKGLFVAHGRVQAGVDLNLLKPENVVIEDIPTSDKNADKNVPLAKNITITLPPAQIFETYLDDVEVYDIKTGLFGAMPTDPEIFNQAQTAGKQQVLASACKSDILKLANDNAQKQVQALYDLANAANSQTPAYHITVKSSSIAGCGG